MKKKLKTDTQFYIKQIRSHNFSPILMIIIVSLEKQKNNLTSKESQGILELN